MICPMTEFNESEFSAFMAHNEERQAIEHDVQDIKARAEAFLMERGIELEATSLPEWVIDDQQLKNHVDGEILTNELELGRSLSAAEIDAIAKSVKNTGLSVVRHEADITMNRLRLHEIVTLIAMSNMLPDNVDGIGTEVLDILSKKCIQAGYKSQNLPSAWHDLADQELPGESLSEADGHLVEEELTHDFVQQIENSELLSGTVSVIEAVLLDGGVTDISPQHEVVLTLLSQAYNIHKMRKSAWQETGRIILMEHGLATNPAWQHVIDHLKD
jgi:hypothetical protein